MDIGLLQIDTEEFSSKLTESVSIIRKNKIEMFINTFDRKISLLSELLLRIMLKESGEKNWRNVEIVENEYGKPIILGKEIYSFSISHSGNIIACALALNNNLGIDIEKYFSIPIEIKDTIFHRNECVQDIYGDDFFNLWTAKEAYSKYIGKGFNQDFSKIDTTSSTFKDHIVQWKENNLFCTVYAENVNDIKIKYYSEKEVLKHYD